MNIQTNLVRRLPATAAKRGGPTPRMPEILDARLWPTSTEDEFAHRFPTEHIEASLLPPSTHLLRAFPVAEMERPYLVHLEQRISRNPRDLLSHVRRVLLCGELRDSDGIAGALADLFLVLGANGKPLRQRMLTLVNEQLAADDSAFFESKLDVGIDTKEPLPERWESRLSKRVRGTTHVVVRHNQPSSIADDPVSLAQESMARAQDKLAQDLLEGALADDPGDSRVCAELLGLYRRRNLRSSFLKTYTTFLGRRLAHPQSWARLAADFRSENRG